MLWVSYSYLWGTQHVISANNKHQISCKYEILSTLSPQEMCCCATRRGIYCWWSVSLSSSDILRWLKELVLEYMSHSWCTMCGFCQKQISNFMHNFSFRTPSQQVGVWYYATRKDTHCCLIMPYKSSNVLGWLEDLPISYAVSLLFLLMGYTTCHFCQ